MTQKYKITDASVREDRLTYVGLLAISAAAVIQYASLTSVDIPLTVALFAFAGAVPFLVFRIYCITWEQSKEYAIFPWYAILADIFGCGGSFVGVAASFWHFSWESGTVFLASSALAGVFLFWYIGTLGKANVDESAQQRLGADAEDGAAQP